MAVTAGQETKRRPTSRWLDLAREHLDLDVVWSFAILALFVKLLERLTDLGERDLDTSWLLGQAATANPLPTIVILIAVAALIWKSRSRLLLRWSDLDRGQHLRALAALLALLLTWRYATYDFNFYFGRWYAPDRLLLIALAIGSFFRPVLLLPLVAQLRLVMSPYEFTFQGFSPDQTIDSMPILVLTAIGSVALLAAVTGRTKTSPFVSLGAAIVAVHFFTPGLAKWHTDWLTENPLANMPLNGYAQGWLGSGDGSLADSLSSALDTFRWPLLVGTLALELAAVVVIARRRAFMVALALWPLFHLSVYLGYGFIFFEWAVVEIGLLLLLAGREGKAWSRPAFEPLVVLVTVAAVLIGNSVFRAPVFSWYEGQVVYRYEFDGVTVEGDDVILVSNDFAPDDGPFAFSRLDLGPTPPLSAGYGAVTERRFHELEAIETWDDLSALELGLDPRNSEARRGFTVELISRFLLDSDRDSSWIDAIPDPPAQFQTSRSGPRLQDGTALQQLTVRRVTTWRVDGETRIRDEDVATFIVEDNEVTVAFNEQS